MTTYKGKLLKFNNDYGFDPLKELFCNNYTSFPSTSIVIPYYESGEIIRSVVKHIIRSAETIKNIFENFNYEILIVDDGSQNFPVNKYISSNAIIKILECKKNIGRADVLIDRFSILNHLKLHLAAARKKTRSAIVVSFFEFRNYNEIELNYDLIEPYDINYNDYRLACEYKSHWWGCEEDKQYIGNYYKIVSQTNFFREWKGMLDPWILTNMVLGGFFSVDTMEALRVNGFDVSFEGYGFEETTLPTKLICNYDNFLIPMCIGGGIHYDNEGIGETRDEKNLAFKEKHNYYFNAYLEKAYSMDIGEGYKRVKVLFLDWNKTLSFSLFWEHISETEPEKHQLITQCLFEDNYNLIDDWMRGKYTSEDICKIIADQTEIPYTFIFETLKESCEKMVFCDPSTESLLRKIKKNGYKLVIATDNMDTFRRFTVPALHLSDLFDDILISSEIGAVKEDMSDNENMFFREYMKQKELHYNETLLLDDCAEHMSSLGCLFMPFLNIQSCNHLITELEKFV
jgi:FMN phosphatase YigB (HAD superfamily)